jgi:lipid-A-disaccharide synthase
MRVGLVAGETSGDLLGAGLIEALREQRPDAEFEGVAGPAMQAAGCQVWESSEALAVMGLVEPLKEIPRLLRLRSMLFERWSTNPPDVFVGIDAPEFNLGLEQKLKRRGIPTVHYVSPSVWAWRQRRVHKIEKATDKVLCLLPFEKQFYDQHGIAAEFVGHRMADSLHPNADTSEARRKLGVDAACVVGVLPGSRSGEVTRLGGVFAEACSLLRGRFPDIHFIAPMANDGVRDLFSAQIRNAGVADCFTVIDGDAATAISASDVVLITSGTATLQTALIGRAMVVAYRLAPLTYAIAKLFRLVKSEFISLPNLLAGEALVPEFIQHDASAEALSGAVAEMLSDSSRRQQMQSRMADLQHQLARNADQCAARAVLSLIPGQC